MSVIEITKGPRIVFGAINPVREVSRASVSVQRSDTCNRVRVGWRKERNILIILIYKERK